MARVDMSQRPLFERVVLWLVGFGPVVHMTWHEWRLGIVWFGLVLGVQLSDRQRSVS